MSEYDPHVRRAAKIYGVSEDEVTEEMRHEGKVLNFTTMYAPKKCCEHQSVFYDNGEAWCHTCLSNVSHLGPHS